MGHNEFNAEGGTAMNSGKRMGGLGIAVCLALMAAVSAFAAEEAPKGKDLCLLYGENCPDRKDTINEIIERLKVEIDRGEKVYTKEELERLKRKLYEYQWFLFQLLYSPSSR